MKRITSLLLLSSLIVGCGSSDEPKTSQEPKAKPTSTKTVEKGNPSESGSEKPAKQTVTYQQLISAADQLHEKRDVRNAVKVLTTAIKAKPTRTEAYIKRAAILAEAKLYKQAVGDMNSAIAIEGNNPKFRNTRGYFLLLLKENEAAERDFNKAIDLDGEYPQVYNNRGLVFIGQNQYIKAMNDFRKAIELKPDYVDALNNLGFVFLQMEDPDYDLAIETFNKVLEIDEKYLNALSNRGRTYFKLEKYDAAIADFTKAIEIQPANPQYYLHRSEVYKAAGKDDLAQADLKHVVWSQRLNEINRRIANNPKNVDLWIARGRHMLVKNRIESAEKSLNNAIALDPENLVALTERVKLHFSQQQFEEAVALCTKVIKANGSTDMQSLRGDAYLALGNFDAAIADFEASRRFDSRVVEAYKKRAAMRSANGDAELAKADNERAAILEKQMTVQANAEEVPGPRAFVPVKFEKTAEAEAKKAE